MSEGADLSGFRRALRERELAAREIYVHLSVGPGWATLAVKRDEMRSGIAYVGIAWCAPGDQYDRARGRSIASGRRAKTEALALDHKTFMGPGFVFGASAGPQLDKEAAEALGAWLGERRHQLLKRYPKIAEARFEVRFLDDWRIPRWLMLHCAEPAMARRIVIHEAEWVPPTT